jgi:hypothetical protein
MARKHPYQGKPDHQFWRLEPAIEEPSRFDPVTRTSFRIGREDPVVTAGSCFAQHVARHLAKNGFNFLVTECAHPIIPSDVAEQFNYGLFTARYGNVYTARQLKQLLQRAYGLFEPVESVWRNAQGQIVDPFRPQIQEGGFVSEDELRADRATHFAALRTAIETMSVFVFTLGLTEAWMDVRDGAVFPLAPGVAGGEFDESVFVFQNFGVDGIVTDMQWCIDFIRERNPGVKLLITVSPVPLNATAIDRHVFVSTTYSKAVLRVAAETICSRNRLCDYFPSYEIITSPYARGRYYGPDCREVTEEGVQHVMSTFLRHYGDVAQDQAQAARPVSGETESMQRHLRDMENVMEVLCDEEQITNQ